MALLQRVLGAIRNVIDDPACIRVAVASGASGSRSTQETRPALSYECAIACRFGSAFASLGSEPRGAAPTSKVAGGGGCALSATPSAATGPARRQAVSLTARSRAMTAS